MPLIRVEFDDALVPDAEIERLSQAVRDIVSDTTSIADVFVYANSARIKVQVAPIEIFVEMSEQKIEDIDRLFTILQERLAAWKKDNGFGYPINLTLIPMHWKFAVDI